MPIPIPIPIPISGISEPKYWYRYLLIISLALLSASRKCAFFLDPDFDYFDYFREVQCELERKTHFERTISLYYCPIMWYYVYCQVIIASWPATHPPGIGSKQLQNIAFFYFATFSGNIDMSKFGRRQQFCWQMEDNLNFYVNGKRPQFLLSS